MSDPRQPTGQGSFGQALADEYERQRQGPWLCTDGGCRTWNLGTRDACASCSTPRPQPAPPKPR